MDDVVDVVKVDVDVVVVVVVGVVAFTTSAYVVGGTWSKGD